MSRILFAAVLVGAAATCQGALAATAATLAPHIDVEGVDIGDAELRRDRAPWRKLGWDALGRTELAPGKYEVRFRFLVTDPDGALAVPACADRRAVSLDGRKMAEGPAPMVLAVGVGSHEVLLAFGVGKYERRVVCGQPPRVGRVVRTTEGLGLLRFDSPYSARGGGEAVVYLPPGHEVRRARPVLVGAHPWNGSIWTYAAYSELLAEARARDVVLLMPSGLGNSLYTGDAEDELLRALDALSSVTAVDARAISIWGASMGGAGATTIGFHRPDRFASVTSFFGDSRYDLSTYVRDILHDEESAHRVNAIDVVDNARNLPVWLIHGEQDRTSPIAQSRQLAAALRQRQFTVRFDAVAGAGHDGALVARFLPELVTLADAARIPDGIARVTYRSVRPPDVGAYGVRLERSETVGDAFVDVELGQGGAVRVRRAEGVRKIWITPGSFGSDPSDLPPIVFDTAAPGVAAAWSAP